MANKKRTKNTEKSEKIKLEFDKEALKLLGKVFLSVLGLLVIVLIFKIFLIPLASGIFLFVIYITELYPQLNITAQFFGGILIIYGIFKIITAVCWIIEIIVKQEIKFFRKEGLI